MPRPRPNVRLWTFLTGSLFFACGPGGDGHPSADADGALLLDGDGWVEFEDRGDRFDLVPGGERTISVWLRYTRPQYHAKILFKNQILADGEYGGGFVVFMHQYSSSLGFWHRSTLPIDESGYTQAGTTGTRRVGDGRWHHVTVVQRDTLVEAWVDGRLEFVESLSRTLPELSNDAPILLGWGVKDEIRFAGEIDELSLWSRALSSRELKRLRYQPPPPDAAGLEGYWPMDDGEGQRVRDVTRGGWHGEGTGLRWAQASRPLGPPFRERPAFTLLLAALGTALFYGILRLYGRRLEAQKRSLERQVEARVEDLARTNAEKDRALALVASQAERLKEVNDARARFFTNTSHEFRTPLSLIIGPLSDALDRHGEELDDETRRAIQAALRSGRRLGHLTSQLLDLARLESQTLHLDLMPMDLGEMLQELTQSFRLVAEREQVRLLVQLPEEPAVVLGDVHRLETVFSNLLANAVRFTPPGKQVVLHAAVADGKIAVEVRDDGPGVEPAARERIFERFFQTPLGIRRGGGMGVGLALVRELVELHRGEVRLVSEGGSGAVFRVSLPLSDEGAPDPVAGRVGFTVGGSTLEHDGAPQPAPEDPEGVGDPGLDDPDRTLLPLVLVVEDHPELRDFLRGHLSRHFRVEEAANGAGALDRARESPPDVIVSDIMMPDMDGLELLSRLREDADLESVAVVLLTARAEVQDRIEGLERGADDYLPKPFEPLELTARIRSLIEGRQRLRRRLMTELTHNGSGERPDPGGEGEVSGRLSKLRSQLQRTVRERMGDATLTVDDLAASVAMERTGLYKLMTAEWGITPSDFVREFRLARAAELLGEGHTVAEVAYAVGYGSVSSFSRRFQDRFGSRPGRWAREGAANA